MSYAATTSVPVERSIGEIGALVKKRGGQRFAYFEEPERISIAFEMADRQVRFTVQLFDWRDKQFERDGRNCSRDQGLTNNERLRFDMADQFLSKIDTSVIREQSRGCVHARHWRAV